MIGIDRRLLQNVDWPLIGTGLGFAVLSGLTLASLHVGRAGGKVALRQLAWFGLGMVALLVVASIDYKKLVRIAPLIYVIGLGVLAWWSSGRSRPLRRREHRALTETEKNAHYRTNQSNTYHSGGSGF